MFTRNHFASYVFILALAIPACAQPQASAIVESDAAAASSHTADSAPAKKLKSRNCFMGVPKSTKQASTFVLLKNDGYDVGYSNDRKNPLWAAYTLRSDQELHDAKRPGSKRFTQDNRVTAGVTHNDYTNSGYDRGHMAPSDAIGKWYGKAGQNGTFIVTNICPQKHKMNDEVWGGLEGAEVYIFPNQFDQIWVICGPIFGADPDTIKNDVQVPDAFYKIIVEDDDNEPHILAVIMEQEAEGADHALKEFTTGVTVDKIEEKTGLDFFPNLPDDVEDAVEAAGTDDEVWGTDLILNDNKMRKDAESE